MLNCLNCKQSIDIPKVLPCGATICNLCERHLVDACVECGEVHAVPAHGFPVNIALKKIIDQRSLEIKRGEA